MWQWCLHQSVKMEVPAAVVDPPRACHTPCFHGSPSGSTTGRLCARTPTTCFFSSRSCDVQPWSRRQTSKRKHREHWCDPFSPLQVYRPAFQMMPAKASFYYATTLRNPFLVIVTWVISWWFSDLPSWRHYITTVHQSNRGTTLGYTYRCQIYLLLVICSSCTIWKTGQRD